MGPPITLFLTTIASHPELRRRQEYLLRIFQVKKIAFQAYDMASDESARRLWKRKVPPEKQQLPGFLVDNMFIGTVDEFEVTVEQGDAQMRRFLRLDEEYNAEIERLYNVPAPEVVPIGVPGVQLPSEISGHKTVFHGDKNKPIDKSKVVRHDQKLAEGEIDLTEALGGFGLEGVTVTEDELLELIAGLGLEDKQADELVKGITESSAAGASASASAATTAPAVAPPPSPSPKPKSTATTATTTTTKKKSTTQTLDPKSPTKVTIPPSPVVTITDAPTSTSTSEPPLSQSPGALTPIAESSSPTTTTGTGTGTGIMASREVMQELAKRVEAKRRTRTDIKLKRLPSLSLSVSGGNSPLASPGPGTPAMEFPSSPSGGGEMMLTPSRQRKSSMFGKGGKPTLPPPTTTTMASPRLSAGGLAGEGVELPSSPSVVPIIKTPVRERKPSVYESSQKKVAFPVTEGGEDGVPTIVSPPPKSSAV